MGNFHREKVVISFCEDYLIERVIDSVLVENEIYEQNVVKSVMKGANYIRGKRYMFTILNKSDSRYVTFFEFIFEIQSLFEGPPRHDKDLSRNQLHFPRL